MTGRQVFDRTMSLIDEADEDKANVDITQEHFDQNNVNDYYSRSLLILNILGGELYPYDSNYAHAETGRGVFTPITSMTTAISLDDYITGTVMPYGLAAHLLLDENKSAASYFNERYAELLDGLKKGLPTVSVDIEDVYGTYDDYGNQRWEYNWHARW